MIHVTILIPREAHVGTLDVPRQVFTAVNHFLASAGKGPLFEVHLAGVNHQTNLVQGLFVTHTQALIHDIRKTNLVIVPAFAGDNKTAIETNQELISWIRDQYTQGAEIASLCVGAFLVASSGILNGKRCATHWMHANEFRRLFPEVNLADEKVITEEHGIYSSGGAFSYLNLLLHLVEKFAGREIAVLTAKVFAIEIDRRSQSPFIIFQGQKDHDDEAIRATQEFIEKNFQEKITVDQLADMSAIGRRNLERRFKKATTNTVVEYVQRVKIEAAKKNLENRRKTINEVMYDVGYSDMKAFRSIFRKITGLSPLEYRNKFNREVEAW